MNRVFSIEEKVDRIAAEVKATKDSNDAIRKNQQNVVDTCQKRVEAMELMIAEFQEKLDVTIEKLVLDIDENNKRDMIVQATVDQQLVNINELRADLTDTKARVAKLDAEFTGAVEETRAHAEAVDLAHKASVEEATLWREEQAAEMRRNADQFGEWETNLR